MKTKELIFSKEKEISGVPVKLNVYKNYMNVPMDVITYNGEQYPENYSVAKGFEKAIEYNFIDKKDVTITKTNKEYIQYRSYLEFNINGQDMSIDVSQYIELEDYNKIVIEFVGINHIKNTIDDFNCISQDSTRYSFTIEYDNIIDFVNKYDRIYQYLYNITDKTIIIDWIEIIGKHRGNSHDINEFRRMVSRIDGFRLVPNKMYGTFGNKENK